MASAQHSGAAATPASATDASSHSLQPTTGLPPMRFADGNVIIHISADPRESLLVHEDYVCAIDPLFDAELRRPWTQSKHVVDPLTGESRKIIEFSMVAQDETFFLVVGTTHNGLDPCEFGSAGYSHLFCQNPEWSKFVAPCYVSAPKDSWAETAGQDFKILIALMYGAPLSLADIIANTKSLGAASYQEALLIAVRIIDVLALAEMRGCFDSVAKQMTQILMGDATIWDLVRQEPATYTYIGKILKCDELFRDGLQHMFSHAPSRIGEILDLEDDEEQKLMQKHRTARDDAELRLKRELRDLGLAEVPNVYYAGRKESYFTTFLNAITHRRGKQDKKAQRSEFIALSIWSQFATQHFEHGGAYLVYRTTGRTKPRYIEDFASELQLILDAAKSDKPSSLFGHKVAEGHAKLFGKDNIDRDALEARLIGLVTKAAEVIEKWGDDRSALSGIVQDGVLSWADVDGLVLVYPWENRKKPVRSSRRVVRRSVPLQVSAKPAPKSGSVAERHSKLYPEAPSVNLAPASEAWLGVLGLLEAPEAQAGEEILMNV